MRVHQIYLLELFYLVALERFVGELLALAICLQFIGRLLVPVHRASRVRLFGLLVVSSVQTARHR